jgi:hypothetical protein
VPLIVGGATISAVGVSLVSYGVMSGLGEGMCNALSGIPAQGEPGETGEPGEPNSFFGSDDECDKGAGVVLATGLILTLIGIPAIVIGAQRVPAKPPMRAVLVPLAMPKGAGLGIRIEL